MFLSWRGALIFVFVCVCVTVKITVLNWTAKWNLPSTYHQRQKLESALHYIGCLVSVKYLSFKMEFLFLFNWLIYFYSFIWIYLLVCFLSPLYKALGNCHSLLLLYPENNFMPTELNLFHFFFVLFCFNFT